MIDISHVIFHLCFGVDIPQFTNFDISLSFYFMYINIYRMKKKARFQALSDIEAKYNVIKERESLDLRRRQHLIEFIENASAAGEAKKCVHSSKLVRLASQVLLKPEFSVTNMTTSVCTSDNTALVKISARGTTVDLESTQKTVSGVISVIFIPASVVISDVSLYWHSSLPENITSSGSSSLQPSVSVLSFDA